MNSRTDLLELAYIVRSEAELMCSEGNTGPAIDQALQGACGDVSLAFATLAGLTDCFEAGDFDDFGHCWVRVDQEVWDLTATQFGINERVYVTRETALYWTELRGQAAIDDLVKWADPIWRQELIERAQNRWLSLNVAQAA